MQFVWPQRFTSFNIKKAINENEDYDPLLKQLGDMKRPELLKTVFEKHQDQALFHKSDYRPVCLLTFAVYLSKHGQFFE